MKSVSEFVKYYGVYNIAAVVVIALIAVGVILNAIGVF